MKSRDDEELRQKTGFKVFQYLSLKIEISSCFNLSISFGEFLCFSVPGSDGEGFLNSWIIDFLLAFFNPSLPCSLSSSLSHFPPLLSISGTGWKLGRNFLKNLELLEVPENQSRNETQPLESGNQLFIGETEQESHKFTPSSSKTTS